MREERKRKKAIGEVLLLLQENYFEPAYIVTILVPRFHAVFQSPQEDLRFILESDVEWQSVWKSLNEYSAKVKYLTGCSVINVREWEEELTFAPGEGDV